MNRTKNGSDDFETYRQIAPETLDDQSLRDLMKTHLNDKEAITSAIQNIWHDTPDKKAVGSDWVTTTKTKKEVPTSKSVGGRGPREGGGRGGSARGRGPPNAGRGGSSGRGERDRTGGRGSTSKPSFANGAAEQWNDAPSAAVASNGWGVQPEAILPAEPVEAPKPPQVTAAPSAPVGWGGGPTLAERLKKKAVEEAKKPETPVEAAEKAGDAEEQAGGRKAAARQRGRRRDKDRGRRGSEGNAADKDGEGSVSASPAVASRAVEGEAANAEAPEEAELPLSSAAHQQADQQAPDGEAANLQSISDALNDLAAAVDQGLPSVEAQLPESLSTVAAASDPSPAVSAVAAPAPAPALAGKAAESSGSGNGVLPVSVSNSSAASSSFLKLGKWEAPIEAAPEAAVFQFGSFGAEDSKPAAAAVGAASAKPSSWPEEPLAQGLQESPVWPSEVSPNSSAVASSASASSSASSAASSSSSSAVVSNGSSSMNALFPPVSKVAGLPSLEPQASNAAGPVGMQPRAPPGLEQGSVLPAPAKQNPIQPGGGANSNRSAPGQQVRYKSDIGQSSAPSASLQQQAVAQQQLPQQPQQVQQLQQQQLQQSMLQYQQPQPQPYSQALPPGITTTTNRNTAAVSTAAGLTAPVNSLPPYYPPVGFEQYASYPPNSSVSIPLGVGSQAVSGVGAAGLGTASSAAGAASNSSNVAVSSGLQQQQPQQQQQQQQQYTAAASLPFYPYYNQYYYGQQVPNYFGQGRGIYQQPRGPYPTDMYGSAGSLYPGEVYPGNQFSDAPNYGGMAMHQGAVGVAGSGAANGPGAAAGGAGAGGVGSNGPAGGNKALKGGAGGGLSIPGTQQQNQQAAQNQQAGNVGLMPHSGAPDHSAHLNSSYGYGVNPYNRSFGLDAQWQYQQGQGAGWGVGAPMMAFPSSANPSAAGGGVGLTAHNQGFTQQQPQQQQQQQQHVGMGMGPSVQQGLPMQQQQGQGQGQQQRSAFPGQGGRNAGGSTSGGGSWLQ